MKRYKKMLYILADNPEHPSLRLHKLKGKLRDYHSISISMQYRVIVHIVIIDKKIYFIDIGGHEIY